MDEKRLISILESIDQHLSRLTEALEAIAWANSPKEPNFIHPITDYQVFAWDSIGAEVIKKDETGVTQVKWGGYIWTRRSPQNKFGEAIWFSRPAGKNSEGQTHYARLITFRKLSEVEPVPAKVLHLTGDPVIDIPGLPPQPVESGEIKPQASSKPSYEALKAEIKKINRPSEAVELVSWSDGPTVFWLVVEKFKIVKERANSVVKSSQGDWRKAILSLDKE